jgi:rod shape-determining protein MreC
MKGLLEFFYKHNHWLLFLLLEGISLFLLFTFNDYQGRVWMTSAGTVTGGVLEAGQRVTGYFGLTAENRRLAEQNAALEEQVFGLRQMLDSIALDRLTAETENEWPFSVVPATVIENSTGKPNNFITINKGTLDGINPDMGVISSDGVVGVTFRCSAHYTLVLPILNSKSNLSCKVRPGDSFGYLEWRGIDARNAQLCDVPRYADISVGDTVVTSGHSAFFPEGLMVGIVAAIEPSADNLSNDISVRLATSFARLKHVFVIGNTGADERRELLKEATEKTE